MPLRQTWDWRESPITSFAEPSVETVCPELGDSGYEDGACFVIIKARMSW